MAIFANKYRDKGVVTFTFMKLIADFARYTIIARVGSIRWKMKVRSD